MGPMRWLMTLVLCAVSATTAQASEVIWEALRAPGSVVVVRHSYAPGTFDPPDAKIEDCSTQRNLDESGRAQARRIGEAFRGDEERRRRQLVEIRTVIAEHRAGPPLVLVTHGSVVSDLTGLDVRMGAFVVLRRGPDGRHAVAGHLYIE